MSETRDDLREALARWLNDRFNEFAWDLLSESERGANYRLADDCVAGPLASILAQVSALQAEVEEAERIRKGHALELQDAQQAAGQALGYPWFKDDQKNFPGSTEADGVCIGDHAGSTIVHELASAYAKVKAEVERLQKVEGEREASLRGILTDAQPTISRQGDLILLDCPDGTITDALFDALEQASYGGDAPSDNPLTETKEGSDHV